MRRPVLDPWTISKATAGVRKDVVDVAFSSRGLLLHGLVPSKELWGSVKDILVLEEYEVLPGFDSKSLTGQTIVDLGAQVGFYSMKMAPFAAKVISYEPNRANFRLLQTNIRRNHLQNVLVEQKAIWSSIGTRLPFSEGGAGFVSEVGGGPGDYEVESTTLDEIVASAGEVGLLKIDVEGSEYEAFESCRQSSLRKIRRIVAEIHVFKPEHPVILGRVFGSLEEAGFILHRVDIPAVSARSGFSKPWRCALESLDGRNPFLYRWLLSVVYGMSPFSETFKRSIDIGTQFLLFADRG